MIDFHTHIVPPSIKQDREDYFADPLFRSFYDSPKAKLATAEDLIARMDKDGVDISIVLNIGWSNQAFCVRTNDYLMESVARYPKRLAGFGTVALESGDEGLREVERCASGGLLGIGEMRLERRALDPNQGGILERFVKSLVSAHLALLVHSSEPVGHQYPGKWDTTPDMLYGLITRFPELILVCAHWGGGLPLYGLMPEVKEALAQVYFDTAASPYLYSPKVYEEVIRILGPDSILFGTDYPLLTPARLLREIKSLGLPGAVENSILSENAVRLLTRLTDGRGGRS
jgi:predicted TIM-barrel fold metal-dependent hydrolase